VRIDIVTLFPEMCREVLSAGVVGRAVEGGVVRAVVTDIRRFTDDRHATVDSTPYGGGAGMILQAPPVVRAVESVRVNDAPVYFMSPGGRTVDQALANTLVEHEAIVLVCGRYKGIDERAREILGAEEISLGDFVLSGGELAALAITDAVVRRLPGTLGCFDSAESDSFSAGRDGLLDAAWYTRPSSYRGLEVPDVLLSGDHGAIARWRDENSRDRTRRRRPDLLEGGEPFDENRR